VKSVHVNPCIEATVNAYKTMLGIVPFREGELKIKKGIFPVSECMGVIGLTGTVRGAMLIGMKEELACKTVSLFLGQNMNSVNEDVLDGIGEITNIIAGSAAAKLSDFKIGLGLPTVLLGKEYKMFSDINSPWIVIPMKTNEIGKFQIAITMEEVS